MQLQAVEWCSDPGDIFGSEGTVRNGDVSSKNTEQSTKIKSWTRLELEVHPTN